MEAKRYAVVLTVWSSDERPGNVKPWSAPDYATVFKVLDEHDDAEAARSSVVAFNTIAMRRGGSGWAVVVETEPGEVIQGGSFITPIGVTFAAT